MDDQNSQGGGAPAGDQPAAPPVEQPVQQKCVTCGNAASGGNCVACGLGEVTCTCTPAGGEQGGAPSGEPSGQPGGEPAPVV